MSGVRISVLPAANAVAETDLLPVVQGTGPVKTARSTTVGAVLDMAVQAASGYAEPQDITTTPGDSRTLADADRGYTLIWDDAATLPVILPDDLAAGFQVALMQAGAGGIVVQPAGGVTVVNRLGHNGTAGEGSVILLMQGSDAVTYSLLGDTGFALAIEAPEIADDTVTADEAWEVGTEVIAFTAQREAGAVTWSITAGNGAGKFAIGAATGIVTLAGVLDTGVADTYSLTIQATNAFGSDTATLGVSVIAAGYDPIAAGADAWFQPRRLDTRTIIDPIGDGSEAYAYILDAQQRGPQLYAASDPYAYPRPTLVTAGQFNGLDTASFTDVTSRLVGNDAAIDAMEGVTSIALEMVVAPVSLAALSNVITQRISGILTLFGVDITTDGAITVSTRRQTTDSVRTVTTAVAMRVGRRHYLYVGINYSTGLITVQLDDVTETFAGTWTGGTGSTPATMTGALTVGGLGGVASMRLAELAIYGGTLLDLSARTAHRADLLAVYDLAGTSVPGTPEEVPVLTGVDFALDDSYLSGRLVAQIRVDNVTASGATTYAITGGNTGAAFAIDAETGNLTTAINLNHLVVSAYALEIEATNDLGSDSATFNITVGPAVYNPDTWDAWYWGQIHNDASRTVVDQSGTPSVSLLNDLLASTANLYAGGGSFLNPTLVTTWNGYDVATFGAANVLLAGNERVRDVAAGASVAAVEMAIAIVSTAATRDVVRWSTASAASARFKVDIVSGGAVRVTVARLDTDATRTFSTTATVTAGAKNYLFVSVNFGTGLITVQINGTTETTTVVWDGGYGVSASGRSASFRLGYYSATPSMQVAELAFYRDTAPNAAERAINRTALTATYGLV